jgi:hypothetical protein
MLVARRVSRNPGQRKAAVATDEKADRSLVRVDLFVRSLSQTFDLVGGAVASNEFGLMTTEVSMLHFLRG